MYTKTLVKRVNARLTKEEQKILQEICKLLKVNRSKAIRVCICDYWERI